MARRLLHALPLVAFLAVACADSPVLVSSASPDWPALTRERVPVIVTRNEDGSEKRTKIWVVIVDGHGYIRTGDTGWFANIQRELDVTLEIGGAAYPLRAGMVSDPARRSRVNEAFRAKYGWQDRMIHPFGAPNANLIRLDPRS